jgi:cell division protein FtsB
MSMRVIVYGLLALLVLIQYPLWIGKGGWLYVYELDKQVKAQEEKNRQLQLRNAKLEGDVKDLKDGTRAIEERARIEHGMVKDNEILVQILQGEDASKASKGAVKPDAAKADAAKSDAPKTEATQNQVIEKSADKVTSSKSADKKSEKIAQ